MSSREDLPARAVLVAEAAAKALRLEVVDDHEPALLQISAERRRLAIGHHPPVGLDDVGDGILEEIGVVERQRVDLLGVGTEERDLIHDAHEVLFGERMSVAPCRPSAVPESRPARSCTSAART